MSKILLPILLSAVLGVLSAVAQSPAPDQVLNQVHQVEALMEKSFYSMYRVQLQVVAPDVMRDPPPTSSSFGNAANVIITVDAVSCYEVLKQVIRDVHVSNWRKVESQGYARWYWRILGPWDDVPMELLIDRDNSLVYVAGSWYQVDPNLVHRITDGFVDFSNRRLLLKLEDIARAGSPYLTIPDKNE